VGRGGSHFRAGGGSDYIVRRRYASVVPDFSNLQSCEAAGRSARGKSTPAAPRCAVAVVLHGDNVAAHGPLVCAVPMILGLDFRRVDARRQKTA
jgi:hypothetical protein